MSLFLANTYTDALEECLKDARGERRRGALKELAEALKVHPTYVSQTLLGKSYFNVDQTLLACAHFRLDGEETEHLLDLLNRDRAALAATRAYFQERIDNRQKERLNLKRRFRETKQLSPEQESVYYEDWSAQAIHMQCQLPGKHSVASIAKALKISPSQVERKIRGLTSTGFLEEKDGGYVSLRDSFHLGKDSRSVGRLHANWRVRTLQELATGEKPPESVHYSSVVTIDEPTAKKIREAVLGHLEATRADIAAAPSRGVYFYSLDFYRLS